MTSLILADVEDTTEKGGGGVGEIKEPGPGGAHWVMEFNWRGGWDWNSKVFDFKTGLLKLERFFQSGELD